VSTIFTTTDIRFFTAIMMALVFAAVRGRIEAIGRFSEILFLITLLLLVCFLALLIPTFHINWVTPVTYKDIIPSIKGSLSTITVYSILSYYFFIGDSVSGKMEMMKKSKKVFVVLTIIPFLIIAMTIGNLGPGLTARSSTPFFGSMKIVSFMQPFDRLEAVILSAWVAADFALIAGLAIALSHMAKKLFNARESKYNAAPIALIGFIGGTFITSSRNLLDMISRSEKSEFISVFVALGFPLIALVTGMIRKLL